MSRRPDGAAGRWAPWTVAWAALTALLWLLDMGSGINLADGVWIVQVLDRVGDGDRLYGDVFYHVPPLSVWVALLPALALGSSVALAKALASMVSAALALVAVDAARRLGVGRAAQALVGLASVAYLVLPSLTIYNPLAALFALAALDLVLVWTSAGERESPGSRRATWALAAAGAAAGLSIASKHTTGFAALAALVATAVLLGPREWRDANGRARDAGIAIGAALAVAVLLLVPIAAQGSLGEFWTYAFEKGEYVASASISYLDSLEGMFDLLASPFDQPLLALSSLRFLIPPLALALLAVAGRSDPRLAATLALFTAGAFAAALPRADGYQFSLVIPVAAVSIAWAVPRIGDALGTGPRLRLALPVVIAAVLLLTFEGGVSRPAFDSLRRGEDPASADFVSGPLVGAETDAALDALGPGLAEADGGEDATFVLSPNAGLAYLLSGLKDPTAFDYPLNTAIRDDDDDLISRIESGNIQRVCLGPYGLPFGSLMPTDLVDYVRGEMLPVRDVGGSPALTPVGCTLYERAP